MGWSSHLRIVGETGSTNADLVAAATRAPEDWPHLSVLLAMRQTAGRGRAGRRWDTGAHQALTCSVVLRPTVPTADWGWVPLLAGAAVVRAVRALAGAQPPVGLKWPNDVVVDRSQDRAVEELPGWGRLRKVGGLLAEVLPDRSGVVVGIGVNLAGDRLPVPWATTLADIGVDVGVHRLLQEAGEELARLMTGWSDGADPSDVVTPLCLTLGREVVVELPDGARVAGTAAGLDGDGALVVDTGTGRVTVLAGDVAHLRS